MLQDRSGGLRAKAYAKPTASGLRYHVAEMLNGGDTSRLRQKVFCSRQ